ncbi:MAG TPA: DinB family protein [Ktedonobacterales bacterium]|nr:DinB family protein [Ktedonobacterales bacterium]
MRATTLLERQLATVNAILHDLAGDLTSEELTTRVLPNTNLLGFDLWHVARTQDWAAQTLVRGAPEVIDEPRWQGRGRLVTHGIGVGLSENQADEMARSLALSDILEYADAVHQTIITWLSEQPDGVLDAQPDVPTHLARYPVYLEQAMRDEVPWMFQQPTVFRCLSPAIGHNRDHLAEMDLLKRQLRTRKG